MIVQPFGRGFGSLRHQVALALLCSAFFRACYGTIRGAAIRVRRVVVVGVARRVHVPDIVAVAAIRRTQPAVLRYSLHPVIFPESLFVRFFPGPDQVPGLDRLCAPVNNPLC